MASMSSTPIEIGIRGLWRGRRSRIPFRVSAWVAGLWVIGALATLTILLPTIYLIVRATGAGAEAWQDLLNLRTLEVLGKTVWLAVSVTLLSALIAVPLAWLTTRTDLPLRRMWAIVTPLPLVIPSYVGAYLIASALGPRGLVQQWLQEPFGVTRLPEIYGYPGALLTLTLLSYPYIFLSTRAVLQQMDPALEEASRSLNQNAWQTFWKVTLPLLRPALGAGGLLIALYVLRDFGAVSIMRYDTFTRVIYMQYRTFDRSQAALLSLALVALTLVFVFMEARVQRRARYYQHPNGAARAPRPTALGRWKIPALLFCGLVIVFSLVLPAGVLGYWLARGVMAGEVIDDVWRAAGNSVLVSGLGALAAIGVALPLSVLMVRHANKSTRLIERISFAAFALPGIVVALTLVFFGATYAPMLYQTLPMLLFAYLILFLPQGLGAVRSSLLQIHPSLEEAAASLGRRPAQIFSTITFPLLRPGVIAGASLVFLTAMKELPATLILAPIGMKTLATSVWGAVSEAFFAQAAAPALLLILMSSLPMAFFILRERGVQE